jgi:hypothetical protein
MAKILSNENKRSDAVIVAALAASIVITNTFVILSPDENTRFYNASITSTITVGVALTICLIQVYRYKTRVKSQLTTSKQPNTKQLPDYYNNNKMHLSICLFLGLWFIAHVIWTFPYQQSSDASIADVLWFVGYGFFGYFLYSLYFHSFRYEFEPLVLLLIAVVIVIVLIFIVDVIVSTLRLLSSQTMDISILLVTVAYPILDAIMIFPAILIFWAARRISSKRIDEQKIKIKMEESKRSSPVRVSSIWILLLSISMILSAIGDTGFAFSTAYGPDTVQRDVWIWDIFYNSFGLCLAAALLGYKNFFSFHRIDTPTTLDG